MYHSAQLTKLAYSARFTATLLSLAFKLRYSH